MGVHEGHRKRLIGRFLAQGLEGFEPHQVLELLLFYTIPRQDTNELAHTLLNAFGSLSGVLDAPYERLLEVKGVGENTAAFLKLVPAAARLYCAQENEGAFLNSAETAGQVLKPHFLGLREEMVYAAFADAKGKCLAVERIHRGSINAAEVNVRALVARAMQTGAAGVLLAHNHPGGMALPSQEDVQTTLRLKAALETVEIQLMDHLVFADGDFVSLRQSGIW